MSIFYPIKSSCSFKAKHEAAIRLICFPCAGGNASFFSSWERDLPASIEVCALPWFTLENHSEACAAGPQDFASYSALVATLAEAIRPGLDCPFALYGHSLGALAAYEVACYLRRHYALEPMGLFFAGYAAPQVFAKTCSFHENEEESLKEERIQTLLSSLLVHAIDLQGDNEQRVLMEAVLKRQVVLWSTYVDSAAAPFRCPLRVFGGWQDELYPYATLPPWKIHTTGAFSLRMFSGDHFFPYTHTPMLVEMIGTQLTSDGERPQMF